MHSCSIEVLGCFEVRSLSHADVNHHHNRDLFSLASPLRCYVQFKFTSLPHALSLPLSLRYMLLHHLLVTVSAPCQSQRCLHVVVLRVVMYCIGIVLVVCK